MGFGVFIFILSLLIGEYIFMRLRFAIWVGAFRVFRRVLVRVDTYEDVFYLI